MVITISLFFSIVIVFIISILKDKCNKWRKHHRFPFYCQHGEHMCSCLITSYNWRNLGMVFVYTSCQMFYNDSVNMSLRIRLEPVLQVKTEAHWPSYAGKPAQCLLAQYINIQIYYSLSPAPNLPTDLWKGKHEIEICKYLKFTSEI